MIVKKSNNEKLKIRKMERELMMIEEGNRKIRDRLQKYYDKVQDNKTKLIYNVVKRDNLMYESKVEISHLICLQSKDRSTGKIIKEVAKRFYLKLLIDKVEDKRS